MKHRFSKTLLCGALASLLAASCGGTPSRAPLGGNYAVAAAEPARDRQAHSVDASPSDEPVPTLATAPVAEALAKAASADAGAAAPSKNLLRYDPLKAGDQIKGELSVYFKARMESGGQGALPGNGVVLVDAKFRVDLKIVRASSQTLDELELTLAAVSLRTEFGGHTNQVPQTSAKTFDITLGRSPSVREQGGAPLDAEERAILTLLVTPLADFHERWSRSPMLELEPGFHVKVPITVPAFMSSSSDTMHIGPFEASYSGRDAGSTAVPLQVSLPIAYGTDVGKLDFDLAGSARLSASQARPLSIDLSGPLSGGGGPHGEVNVRGDAKFAATLSYL
jgi:hypothetical protein